MALSYYSYTETYIFGNAAKQRALEIEQRKQRVTRELEKKREEEERKERLQERRAAAIQRNHSRELSYRRSYVFLAAILGVLTAFSAVIYIHLQNRIDTQIHAIEKIESELEDVVAENTATQKRINAATDMKHIKDVAMNSLRMEYADQDQIIYYTPEESDYMCVKGDGSF